MRVPMMVSLLVFFLAFLLFSAVSVEASTTAESLAWDMVLGSVAKSFTGPTAYAVAAIMLVTGIASMLFGHADFAQLVRWILVAAALTAALGGVGWLVEKAFGITGVLI